MTQKASTNDIESNGEQTPLLSRTAATRRLSEDNSSTPTETFESSHLENHANYSEYIKHAVIGFADGLTVPFALTAGVSA
jgi:hypothetical protein